MDPPSFASTYGSWMVSLFLETVLYGVGLLQAFLYFQWWPMDDWKIKAPVVAVMFFETVQVTFFFGSTYFRFVVNFGVLQGDLVWLDSVQLLANYLSAFTVQLYFASQIYRLTRIRVQIVEASPVGSYIVAILAVTQMCFCWDCADDHVIQTSFFLEVESDHGAEMHAPGHTGLIADAPLRLLQSFKRLHPLRVIFSLWVICVFSWTEKMISTLMVNAVNRGALTAITSGLTLVLFLIFPNTFWFFLPMAPNSKLYMNSMLATLNMRQHMAEKVLSNPWNTGRLGSVRGFSGDMPDALVSTVEFVRPVDAPEIGASSSDIVMSFCSNGPTARVSAFRLAVWFGELRFLVRATGYAIMLHMTGLDFREETRGVKVTFMLSKTGAPTIRVFETFSNNPLDAILRLPSTSEMSAWMLDRIWVAYPRAIFDGVCLTTPDQLPIYTLEARQRGWELIHYRMQSGFKIASQWARIHICTQDASCPAA
ncbi:hypothetical protein B0H13DRAFT_1920947 [Mycena leptocephala]|nr:hypothetical protein B0H13DRAFT_1920947 [Mycena leptocephala]